VSGLLKAKAGDVVRIVPAPTYYFPNPYWSEHIGTKAIVVDVEVGQSRRYHAEWKRWVARVSRIYVLELPSGRCIRVPAMAFKKEVSSIVFTSKGE